MENGIKYIAELAEWKGSNRFSPDAIRRVLEALGDPQDKIKSVHVAGTNGKGSVSCAVASILGHAGYRVGLTISPHLSRINERIIIDGVPVSDSLLAEHGLILKHVTAELGIRLSQHEGLTALAFMIFSHLKLDWMVVEVGLGGRLDSSNVMRKPSVAVITSIDFDHVELLGGTLTKIATEKAGILREMQDVIIGRLPHEALDVVQQVSREKSASLHILGRDFDVLRAGKEFVYVEDGLPLFSINPALLGAHQIDNMAVALRVSRQLNISPEACKAGVAGVYWPGRLERVFSEGAFPIYLDCAHNPAGVRALISFLDSSGLPPPSLVFGALDTKDWKEMVSMLCPHVGSWIIVPPKSDRAVPAESLVEYLSGFGISARTFTNYDEVAKVIKDTSYVSPVVAAGSMYMIGALRDQLVSNSPPYWVRSV